MNPILERFRRSELRAQHEAKLASIAREVDAVVVSANHPTLTLPGDRFRLRGIPVVGVHGGVGGAIAGTKPGADLR